MSVSWAWMISSPRYRSDPFFQVFLVSLGQVSKLLVWRSQGRYLYAFLLAISLIIERALLALLPKITGPRAPRARPVRFSRVALSGLNSFDFQSCHASPRWQLLRGLYIRTDVIAVNHTGCVELHHGTGSMPRKGATTGRSVRAEGRSKTRSNKPRVS